MKKILFILIVFAAGLNASQRIIPEAELTQKLAFYQKIKTLNAGFHQVKNIKSIGMELKSEGEMELMRPDKVVWTIKKPGFSRVELEGSKIKMTSGEGTEQKSQTMILGKETDPNVSKAILSMMAWMRMDVPEIQKVYVDETIKSFSFSFDKEVEIILPDPDSKLLATFEKSYSK